MSSRQKRDFLSLSDETRSVVPISSGQSPLHRNTAAAPFGSIRDLIIRAPKIGFPRQNLVGEIKIPNELTTLTN